MKNALRKEIFDLIYNYKTKYKEGFIKSEIEDILSKYPNINTEKYNGTLRGITCMVIEGETVIFHCDIEIGLLCGLENRDMTSEEWD